MATEKQVNANRQNAQKSTGPRTDQGKARARRNALRHGLAARTILPSLPHEDPQQVEQRIQQWYHDVQPRDAIERELTSRAARLSVSLDRAERMEAAHMARRVNEAQREQTRQLTLRQLEEVCELGRRLLYIAAPEEVKVERMPLWADNPGLLVAQLEATAAGCRWLLGRWTEYRHLLDRKALWEEGLLLRFIRLQGKDVVEAVYDPALNAIFLAWDVIVPTYAREAWEFFREDWPKEHPALYHFVTWQEITDRPKDKAAAWALLSAIVDQQVGRLKQLLARNEAIEAAEDPTWADRAALDCSVEFERLRRYQSAKTRELLKMIDTLCKMRNSSEFGMGKGEMAEGECQMADNECQTAEGEGQMADSECQTAEGECQTAEGELPMAYKRCEVETRGGDEEQSSEPMVEDDDARQSLPENVTTPQKAPNEAKLESTRSTELLGVESHKSETAGRERSRPAGKSGGWVGRLASGQGTVAIGQGVVASGQGTGRKRPGGRGRRRDSGPRRSLLARSRSSGRRAGRTRPAECWVATQQARGYDAGNAAHALVGSLEGLRPGVPKWQWSVASEPEGQRKRPPRISLSCLTPISRSAGPLPFALPDLEVCSGRGLAPNRSLPGRVNLVDCAIRPGAMLPV